MNHGPNEKHSKGQELSFGQLRLLRVKHSDAVELYVYVTLNLMVSQIIRVPNSFSESRLLGTRNRAAHNKLELTGNGLTFLALETVDTAQLQAS